MGDAKTCIIDLLVVTKAARRLQSRFSYQIKLMYPYLVHYYVKRHMSQAGRAAR